MGRAGSQHPRWNDGRLITQHGYVKLRVGRGHPLADPNGYAYEHIVVWVAAGNHRPSRGEALHHINDDRKDNRIQNLRLIKREAHARGHGVRRDPTTGRYIGSNSDSQDQDETPSENAQVHF